MATKEAKLQIVVDAQNRTQGTFNALKSNLDDVTAKHRGLTSAMQGVGTAGAVAFGGLSLLTAGVVKAGADFEQTEVAFRTMLGSADLAQKTLADLAEFASKTPFELPQLEQASKQLLAYGTTAEELIPTMKMLGDITAGVGMDKLPQLILAFGQVKAATKLTGTELRQFTEAGVPMLEALVQHFNKTGKAVATVSNAAGLTTKQIDKLGNANAAATTKLHGLNITLQKQENRMREMRKNNNDSGASWKNLTIDIGETKRKIAETEATISKNSGTLNLATQSVSSFGQAAELTAGQVQEMISNGEVSFQDVEAALASMTGEGGKFFNLMAEQSTTLGGLWSTFKDNVSLTARAIGTELLPYLKPLVTQLIGITQAVGNFAKEHPQLTAAILVGALAFTALLAVLLPLAIALPGIIIMFGALGTAIAVVTAISAPILLVVGAIIAVLAILVSQGYFTKDAWEAVWLGIKLIAADGANAVIATVEAMINFVLESVNRAIRSINHIISLAQKVPGVGKNISKLGEIKADFGRIDNDLIAANDFAGRRNISTTQTVLNMAGSVFLSENVAEQIGDMIMSKLKLSSPI